MYHIMVKWFHRATLLTAVSVCGLDNKLNLRNNVEHQGFRMKKTHPTGDSGSHRQMFTSLFYSSAIGVMVSYEQHWV
jgi:hypothetical protein